MLKLPFGKKKKISLVGEGAFKVDKDNDKKELEKVIQNKPVNKELIEKIKLLPIKKNKKLIRLSIKPSK